MSKDKTNVPAVKEQLANFPALTEDPKEFLETLRENLGGEDLSPFDLDRVTIPTGGSTAWMVPNIDGVAEPAIELLGIIIGTQRARAYWKTSFASTGGGTPPDCISDDGETGVGDPGGLCRDCPYAQFGSKIGEDGKTPQAGQACRQIRRIFLLRPDSVLPLVLNLPPSSLKNSRQYFLRLAGQTHKYFSVVTRVTLKQEKSKGMGGVGGGIVYSQAVLSMAGKLEPEQAAAAAAYAQAIMPTARKVSEKDFDTNPESEPTF